MDATFAALIGGLLGLAVGGLAAFAFRFSEREFAKGAEHVAGPAVPSDVGRVLSVLRSSAVVLGPDDVVLQASAPARALGLVVESRLAVTELLELVHQVRADGQIRERDLELRATHTSREELSVYARLAPIGEELILVLVEDRTKERRLDAIRRDFVANVSHELKTPIGALTLLAEAVHEASADPEAVDRFAARMQVESERLTRLVQQIIELSRVQADDPIEEAEPVAVDQLVEAALDRERVDASTRGVTLQRAGSQGLTVTGSEQQLIIALGNLVENAVSYSAEHTRVVVGVHRLEAGPGGGSGDTDNGPGSEPGSGFDGGFDGGGIVDIAVTDRGVGIPEEEVARVFERFYRVDRARSRETGGTGLGLSIVKHIVASHGGTVFVDSVEGEGSTFTMRLPLRVDGSHESVDVPVQAHTQRSEVAS